MQIRKWYFFFVLSFNVWASLTQYIFYNFLFIVCWFFFLTFYCIFNKFCGWCLQKKKTANVSRNHKWKKLPRQWSLPLILIPISFYTHIFFFFVASRFNVVCILCFKESCLYRCNFTLIANGFSFFGRFVSFLFLLKKKTKKKYKQKSLASTPQGAVIN